MQRMAVAGLALALIAAACGGSSEPATPIPTPALEDGKFFAFVTVGEDEAGVTTLGVDLATMLSGEAARKAAVEDGVIAEGEDLPNDFYIDNDEKAYELLQVSDTSEISVISGNDTTRMVKIDLDDLEALFDGTYGGEPVYGIVANQPIAMDVVISQGKISSLAAVYLP